MSNADCRKLTAGVRAWRVLLTDRRYNQAGLEPFHSYFAAHPDECPVAFAKTQVPWIVDKLKTTMEMFESPPGKRQSQSFYKEPRRQEAILASRILYMKTVPKKRYFAEGTPGRAKALSNVAWAALRWIIGLRRAPLTKIQVGALCNEKLDAVAMTAKLSKVYAEFVRCNGVLHDALSLFVPVFGRQKPHDDVLPADGTRVVLDALCAAYPASCPGALAPEREVEAGGSPGGSPGGELLDELLCESEPLETEQEDYGPRDLPEVEDLAREVYEVVSSSEGFADDALWLPDDEGIDAATRHVYDCASALMAEAASCVVQAQELLDALPAKRQRTGDGC